jgi:hypothetical protein
LVVKQKAEGRPTGNASGNVKAVLLFGKWILIFTVLSTRWKARCSFGVGGTPARMEETT